jgi:hypothetical protein
MKFICLGSSVSDYRGQSILPSSAVRACPDDWTSRSLHTSYNQLSWPTTFVLRSAHQPFSFISHSSPCTLFCLILHSLPARFRSESIRCRKLHSRSSFAGSRPQQSRAGLGGECLCRWCGPTGQEVEIAWRWRLIVGSAAGLAQRLKGMAFENWAGFVPSQPRVRILQSVVAGLMRNSGMHSRLAFWEKSG